MPIYPKTKTFRGGFYNNKVVDGINDRVYTAKDIRKPYDVLYTDGIKPTPEGDVGNQLKVTANGNLTISVGAGYAKLGGAWFENTAEYIITLDNPTTTTKYDCVIIKNDDSDGVRAPDIYVKRLDHIPTINDLVRNSYIYEVCIAYITITSGVTFITDDNITDTRMDGSLCNIMSGVGSTVVRTYTNTYFSNKVNQTNIPIGIPEYNKERDNLTVIVEGRTFSEGSHYIIVNNSNINLLNPLPVINTRIDFEVSKNVNGAAADTVVEEVGLHNNYLAHINKIIKHHYYCNGINDNVEISNLVENLNNMTFSKYNNYRLCVHGSFGATNYISGDGTEASPYAWFVFGSNDTPTSRVVVDFSDCNEITIPVINNAYNTVFLGSWVEIYGASIKAENQSAMVNINTSTDGYFKADKCRFYVTGLAKSFISYNGDLINCYGRVLNVSQNSYCFPVKKYLRLFGGEYLAYHKGDYTSAIAYIDTARSEAAVFASGVSCPKVTISGCEQSFAWYTEHQNNITAVGTITTLRSYNANTNHVIGTINLNIPNTI